MALEKTGLQAVFETAEFNKGLAQYLSGLAKVAKSTAKAQTATQKGAEGISDTGKAASGARSIIQRLGNDFTKLTKEAGPFSGIIGKIGGALSSLGAASAPVVALGASLTVVIGIIAAAAAAFIGFIAITVKATKAFINFIKEAAAEAPKLQGIGTAFEINARKFNVSIADMRRGARGMIADFDLMKQANIALTGASDEFGRQFGQALPILLRAAGETAKSTGQDVNFLFESLVGGVKRSSRLLIDNTGIVLSLGEANQTLADALGVTVEQLTEEQKQIALLNATVEASQKIIDEFGSSELTAAENAAIATANIKNTKDTLGQFMIPILQKTSEVWANFTSAIAKSVQEGGALFPLITNLAARLSILVDVVAFVANSFIRAFQEIGAFFARFTNKTSAGMEDLIINFFTWGAELIAALADGIVQGISGALTGAMNVLQNMLAFWLAPGSPPRIAPHLDQWGAEAFTQYLQGFEKADFGVLKGIQGILGKFLKKPELQAITLEIGAAVAGGPTTEFFSNLQAAAGEFGTEIVKLAQNYFELRDAVNAAEQAQTDLDDALKKITDSEVAVRDLTNEYNELLRAGASDEVLDAQLAQINAAEEQLSLAQEQKKQAEEAKSQAEENIETIKEETALQEELVNQLLALAEEEAKAGAVTAPAAAGAGAGAGAGVAGIGEGIGASLGAGITTGIQAAIEEAKAKLLERLGRIFEPLRTRWNNSIKPTLKELVERFLEFKENVAEAWEEIKERVDPILETLREWWEEKLPDAMRTMQRVIDFTLKPALKRVWSFVRQFLNPEFSLLSDVILPAIESASEAIATFWDEKLLPALKNVRDFILDKLMKTLEDFRIRFIDPIVDAFKRWKDALEGLEDRLARVWGLIESILEGLRNIPSNLPFDVRPPGVIPARSATIPVAPRFAGAGAGAAGGGGGDQFNFGNNTITDPMAFAAFEARVLRVVRQEMGK